MERSFLGLVAHLPEVAALVVTDHLGALLESRGALDGEAAGAVHAATIQSLTRCGDALGLGSLHRVTVHGSSAGCVIAIDEREVLGIYLDRSQSLGALETQLEQALGR